MGLYDDLLEEQPQVAPQKNIKNNKNSGLYDDLLTEEAPEMQPTFSESHPFVSSLPEAAKQFGTRAVKSYPEFAKGTNDLLALIGDKTNLQGLSNFGRSNADFWEQQSNKIQIDPKYQGIKGLSDKSTVLPTIAGSVGDQATNLLMAMGGGAGGAAAGKAAGLGKLGTAAATVAGTSIPNVAQEGTYLDKIQAFQQTYGRMPTIEELKQIQNVALGEKAINTALETVADRLLFGKLFPQGAATKGVKNIAKNAIEQAATEAGTEAMQEGVSIGAEKMLGINQDDLATNLRRVGDSAAIGGITGGVMGGATTAASQPYNTQFVENQNTTNPIEAVKNVSAKIADGGKVLYDSAAQQLNSMVNAPDTFDVLRQLSKDGVFSNNTIEEIAPNTVNKQKAKKANTKNIENNTSDIQVEDTGMPDLVGEGNLYNISEDNEENQIVNQNEAENIINDNQGAEEVAQKPEKPKSKREIAKEKAKNEAIEKIKKLAPNTVERQTAQQAVEQHRSQKKGDILKDNEGNIYEVMDDTGLIRNVDTDEHSYGSMNKTYEKYIPNEKEYIKKQEFKYNPKAKRGENVDNYVYSQQEVVDAYNEYIKNPTLENKEKYQDIHGKYNNEYYQKEESFKKNDKLTQLAPKTIEKVQKRNIVTGLDENGNSAKFDVTDITNIQKVAPNTAKKQQKQIKPIDESKEAEKAAYNILSMASGKNPTYIKMLLKSKSEKKAKEREKFYEAVRNIADQISINGVSPEYAKYFDISAFNDDVSKDAEADHNDNLKLVEQALNIIENGYKSYEDIMREEAEEYGNYINETFDKLEERFNNVKTTQEYIDLLDYVEENIPDSILKVVEERFMEMSSSAAERIEKLESVRETDDKTTGEKDTRNSNEKTSGLDIRETEKTSLESNERNSDTSGKRSQTAETKSQSNVNNKNDIRGVENERKSEETTESSEQNERTDASRQVGTENQSSENNRGSDSTIGRSNNSGLESQRGLIKKHTELINANYKNQHELNTKIEEFINNEEYRQYQPGKRFPQAIKDWLKKYTGAGGLEKQGAAGKGLLSEYYTPQNIVNKMWDITKQYVKTDGAKVLEPSVGIGRFLENAPENTKFDVVEMNPVSAKITKILYPDANVTTGEFQERFIDKTKNAPVKSINPEYDIVIGNPPYGQYSGRYKGLGEGKKFSRLEAYFINRSLDLLKENGIATFIVPSSFLDGVGTTGKQEIASKCDLLDAYRLPEKTFDTTTIGTDIVVLRKRTKGSIENNINSGEWFKQNPEKILGTVEERKNRFGKLENYVKGDKNAVETINTSKVDIKETTDTQTEITQKSNTPKTKTVAKKSSVTQKGQIEYEEYVPENVVSEEDEKYFRDTKVDGTLPRNKYAPNEKVNQYNGELYNDFNYLQGDIYKKLDALEKENISDKQKEIQRKKLNSVLPKAKELGEIGLTPTSDFIREIPTTETVYDRYSNKEITRQTYYDQRYLNYVRSLTSSERNGLSVWDIEKFVNGDKIQTRYRGNPTKEEKANQRAEFLTKLKNTVDKTFNDFLNTELSTEEREKIQDLWNRKFNTLYTPDYKKMPMLVKGLNSKFYGKPLKLQDVQIEGINYLTNKGVGLLGFEVGVGKTLSGIVSTVQNMQMGRCKKPLILVPKQVKPNWIREIKETFPNIKINDIDNLSKFDGVVEDGSLSIGTYQALDSLWYNPDTVKELTSATYEMGNDFNRKSTERGKEKTKERFEEFIGKAEAGNKKKFTFEELGFDHITIDEAHNFKNLFADAKADGQEGNTYSKITGAESTRAKRLFLATQYILRNNQNRNIFMLTATPFNNSPLEVFNMLSYMAKDKLENMGIYNVYQFMENYVDISADWVVDSKNNVVFKQIASGFKNLQSLQSIIDSCMLIRSAEDAGIKRPNKHTKRVTLDPTQEQLDLIAKAEAEAVGMEFDDEGNMRYKDTDGKRNNGEVLRAISKARIATISPDIYNNNIEVSPEDFIQKSPKLNYVMSAVESMKKKDPNTSQLIYMPIGVDFLPKIREYLVNKGVYKSDEIAIIKSGIDDDKINEITDSFNDENGKIKLIIGTNKIKEGMNLNKNSSVLYVPYMDWNPTDFLQIVGRIWRRGNKYKDIRVIVPLLKDSSDPFMFQKLDEKTSRINNIMDRGKDYIDTSELDTAEEKINMIANPEKKAAMFSQIEKQKLESQKNKLQGQLDDTRHYMRELEEAENEVKKANDGVERYEKQLEDFKDNQTSWQYTSAENYLSTYKKDLSKAKQHLKYIQTRIEKLELDFNGKDSETAIQDKIQETENKLEKLKEATEKKLAEYRVEYEKNRKNGKSIVEHIKDFENDTNSLYGIKENSNEEENRPLDVEPKRRYEKTREAAYEIPVINLETKAQKSRKSRTEKIKEKAREIDDAKKYNKVLKSAIHKWNAEISKRRYDADKTLNSFINHTKRIAKELNVTDKNLREVMPFLRERTDLPDKLDRPDLQKTWEKIHNTKGMSERLTKLADSLSDKFEKYYKEYQAVQAKNEDIEDKEGIENYVPHLWNKDGQSNNNLITSAFVTKSKHAKQRKIATYFEGIQGIRQENGEVKYYEPETLDYAELLKKSSDNLIKATVDKVLADSVKSFKTESGASLILPAAQAPSNWVDINHSALNKTVARPVSTKYGEKISPDLQNKLGEIGIAIGNRLAKYKRGGQPNALGKYIKNQPPEIRLQRWFSNKTLAHEVGHALDDVLDLQNDGFVNRHREELLELNKERIEAFDKQGDRRYAEKDSELIAELFGVMFNDVENALKYAPNATSEIMERMTNNDKLKSLLPGNYDWNDAKHVIEEKVVEFFKEPVKVHPDIAATLKTVFEPKKEYLDVLGFKPGKTMDEVNSIAKMFNFSLSGFHAWALSESYLGNVGVKGLKDTFDFKKIYNSVKNSDYDIYKKDKAAKQAINDGLQIGATLDVQRDVAETLINNAGKWLENHIKGFGKPISLPVKMLGKATELNNKALWDTIHNNYKLTAYEVLIQNESKDGAISEAKRKEIAQWVNDSFGGQVWENLGISPTTKKALSRWLMSPDWLLSSTRQFMGMFSSKKGHQKLNELAAKSEFWQKAKETTQFFGINSLTDDINASGTRGRIARKFWARAAIQSLIYMNILNALFRAWDRDKNPDMYPDKMTPLNYSMIGNSIGSKTCVFIGRNQDGTERYVRFGKQFREMPEMLEDPIKKIGGKAAPIPQTISTIFTGHSLSGFENKEMSESKGWKRVGVAAKQGASTFLPFSVGSAIQKGADYSPFDLVATTSKGMSKYKAGQYFKEAYEHGNKSEKIAEIEKSMARNGFSKKDIDKVKNQAKGKYTKQFKDGYVAALESGDKKKIQKISDDMTKKNISPIDQRKIYTKALKEYYKNRGIGA